MTVTAPTRGVVVALLIAVLAGAGACGQRQDAAPGGTQTDPGEGATPVPTGVPHQFVDELNGLPDVFPGFPPDARAFGTVLLETTNSFDESFDLVRRERTGEIPDSDDVDGVFEFYRQALPEQDWTLGEMVHGDKLLFSGHDARGIVSASEDGSRMLIRVSVQVPRPDLEQQPGVMVPTPAWFEEALPELPEAAQRVEAELREGYASPETGDEWPTTLRVKYQMVGEPAEGDVEDAVAHMETATPQAGWTFVEEEDRSDQWEGGDQVHWTDHVVLHYQGRGAYLAVHVFRSGTEGFYLPAVEISLEYTAQPAAEEN